MKAWIDSLCKRDDSQIDEEKAIFYHNPIPNWLRLLIGCVGILSSLPLVYFLSNWPLIDWLTYF